jgi:hypothetical protein
VLAKRKDPSLRERIASARDWGARLRHQQRAAALYESQWARSAARKAKRTHPTHQAKLVMWNLMFRVPLHFAAIPDEEILNACNRFNLPLDTWRRQERAFGLLKKVYAKRAAIRGQPTFPFPQPVEQFQDWSLENETDDQYSY